MYRVDYHLVNGSTGDPALYLNLGGARGALLFDCGHLMPEPVPHLHRVRDIFVSHTHIDHFFGFDWFLRCSLGKDRTIHVWGPAGIRENVECKLRGYTWNIAMDFRLDFVVHEIAADAVQTSRLWCEDGLHLEADVARRSLNEGAALQERHSHWIHYAELDHQTVSLAFSFVQKRGVDLDAERMAALDIAPGPWIGDFKRWVLRGPDRDRELTLSGRRFSARELSSELATVKPGFKLAYVADTRYSDDVAAKVAALAHGADVLYCAGKFLHREIDRAIDSAHLTAREAGRLARLAEVEELVLFHPSKKYQGQLHRLVTEAQQEFPRVRLEGDGG